MPEAFTIAPAGWRPLWILLPVAIIMSAVFVILGLSLVGAQRARFEVSPAALRLRGDMYARTIPIGDLDLAGARRVTFASEPELQPTTRTMGTGLPGYRAGWFRLRSGQKALLYLTDEHRAVYIPTRLGYSLLLSPSDPDAFLASLRSDGARR